MILGRWGRGAETAAVLSDKWIFFVQIFEGATLNL